MMGPSHALSGAAAGLAIAEFVPTATSTTHSIPLTLIGATLAAGAAILPDLDHPNSLATESLGPITRTVSTILRHISQFIFELTGTRKDKNHSGTHRAFTHTIAFAGISGFGISALCTHFGKAAILPVLFLFILLALRGLPPEEKKYVDIITAAALTATAWWFLPDALNAPWLGLCVAAGCLTHCLGDAITEMGVPLLWPLPIGGKTWCPLGTPHFMRFRAGGPFERYAMWPLLVAATAALLVGLVPGAWPTILHATHITA